MHIKRFHAQFLYEVRYRNGELMLKRSSQQQGMFSSNGVLVETTSMDKLESDPNLIDELELAAEQIIKAYSEIDLQLTLTIDHKQINGTNEFVSKWVYVEYAHKKRELIPFTSFNDLNHSVKQLIVNHDNYESLPTFAGELTFDQIVVSQSSFGHLLHEALGHRLESDDYSSPLPWGPSSMNFSVYDTPGTEAMAGYCPIDDCGVTGKDICLYDPKTGNSELLTEESGNSRSTSHQNHSLIRQRCLEVKIHKEYFPNIVPGTLFLDDVEVAKYENLMATLYIKNARILTQEGMQRVNDIEVTFTEKDIRSLVAFEEYKVTNPPGGCHKGLQRGLPISYNTPMAFLRIEE